MNSTNASASGRQVRLIRRWLAFFMVALLFSGLTAVPLVWLTGLFAAWTAPLGGDLAAWAAHAAEAVAVTAETYPILLYGTDWLAFAHVVIALAFIGPWRDPVRNRWVVEWGLWCCALVVLMAFTWAPLRGIPFFWRCVDAAFGVIGAVPLWIVLRAIGRLEDHRDQGKEANTGCDTLRGRSSIWTSNFNMLRPFQGRNPQMRNGTDPGGVAAYSPKGIKASMAFPTPKGVAAGVQDGISKEDHLLQAPSIAIVGEVFPILAGVLHGPFRLEQHPCLEGSHSRSHR